MFYFILDNGVDVGNICYILFLLFMFEIVEMFCLCFIIVYVVLLNYILYVRDVVEILFLKWFFRFKISLFINI